MKRFVRNVLLFLIPVALYFAVTEIPFYYAGYVTHELSDVDRCIELQRNNPSSLYGFGYSEQTEYYKLTNADYFSAPVIALGTSRVMQFKGAYFSKDFYNCGGAVGGNYNQYRNFLENLSYTPDLIILGLDAWVFNGNWNDIFGTVDHFVPIEKLEKTGADKASIAHHIRSDWRKKWDFDDLNTFGNNLGFNGRIKDSGYMIDGSYYYGDMYRYPEIQSDYRFVQTLEQIAAGTARFAWEDHIDPNTLDQLKNLLDYCRAHQIEVVGFLTPYPPAVYHAMADSGNYAYLDEIEPACAELFRHYGYEFYNYMNVEDFPVDDYCFMDGIHGSEVVYAYIAKDMLAKGSVLSACIDADVLTGLLADAYDGRSFYHPDERPD